MEKRIKQSKIWEIMEKKNELGGPLPFSIKYVIKSTGEIRSIERCICTSVHSKGATINIMLEGESFPKTALKCLIVEFNGASVYL